MKLYWYIFILLCFIAACSPSKSNLEQALEKSGENRDELEKVLNYFAARKGDSLKLKSAQFLIANMPGHYSWKSPELIHYWNSMNSLHPNMSSIMRKVIYSIPWHSNNITIGVGQKLEDIKVMQADFLIQHINNTFSMWQNCPWLQNISFDDFCEYLLPYRIGDEPIVKTDSTQYLWKYIKGDMDYYNYTPLLLDDIRSFLRGYIGNSDNIYFTDLDMSALRRTDKYNMDCLDMCYYDVIGLRSTGIPSAIDYVPNWPTRNGRHYWRVIIDPTCANDNYSEAMNPIAGKVYRMSYSHNPIPYPNGIDSIPEFFKDPFMKDVTDKYIKVTNLEVATRRHFDKYIPKNIYLAVFNDLEWKPISWSENKKNRATFEKVGRNVVYLPICYTRSGYEMRELSLLCESVGANKRVDP